MKTNYSAKNGTKLPQGRHPPQKIAGQTKGTVFIVVILSVVILLVLFLFGRQFVGKAYSVGGNSLDLVLTDPNTITFTGQLQSRANGLYFELSSPTPGVDVCSFVFRSSPSAWTSLENTRCTSNRFIFGTATLDPDGSTQVGVVTLGTLQIQNTPDQFSLRLEPVDVYETSTGRDLFPQGETFTFRRTAAAQCTNIPSNALLCSNAAATITANQVTRLVQNQAVCGAPCAAYCRDGYTLQGTQCVANNIAPSCLNPPANAQRCGPLPNVNTTSTLVAACAPVSAVCSYTCNNGYRLETVGGVSSCAPDPLAIQSNPASGGGGPGRSGGGGRYDCRRDVACDVVWSFCNATLQQSRYCFDNELGCQPYYENRTCSLCDESWQCSGWSACSLGTQSRTCYDEHSCGTFIQKPQEKQSCTEQSSYIPPQVQAPSPPSVYVPPQVAMPSFWEKYKPYLIGAAIVLLLGLILLPLLLHRRKAEGYNFAELVQWIGEERKMGTSDEDIHQILKEHTGWTNDEVLKAFTALVQNKGGSVS